MKNVKLIIGILVCSLWSCSNEEYNLPEDDTRLMKARESVLPNNSLNPSIVPNQIVIQYKQEGLTYEQKLAIQSDLAARYYFSIEAIEKCSCDNDSIELWTINTSHTNFIGIENLVKNLTNTEEDEEDVEGDYQILFSVNSDEIPSDHISILEEKVVANNNPDAVNIAILDTGVDYDYFPDPFLYNSSNTTDCTEELSGWDFVNNDYDARDDHGHGTMVTKIIVDALATTNTPFHILPVKAFDQQGRGNYFNVTCGLQYIAKKKKRFLVNASFGFYKIKNQGILENIINGAAQDILLISSAGNMGIDTDQRGNQHFPSSYGAYNILTVGGYEGDFAAYPAYGDQYVSGFYVATDSNRGGTSIDIAAPFEHEILLDAGDYQIEITARGTSFSAAYATGRAAARFHNNPLSPSLLKQNVLQTGFSSSSFNGLINNNKILVKGFINTPIYRPLH